MDRPKKEDYWLFDETISRDDFLICKYQDNLEAYCDELEKALELACEKLGHSFICSSVKDMKCPKIEELQNGQDEEYCKECWKKYLLGKGEK